MTMLVTADRSGATVPDPDESGGPGRALFFSFSKNTKALAGKLPVAPGEVPA